MDTDTIKYSYEPEVVRPSKGGGLTLVYKGLLRSKNACEASYASDYVGTFQIVTLARLSIAPLITDP